MSALSIADWRISSWLRYAIEPRKIVFLSWLGMCLAAAYLMMRHTSPYLYWDEWELAEPLASRTLDPSWLWQEHNGHRIPLPKLIFWVSTRIAGPDPRVWAGMTIVILAATSWALVRAMRQIRGHTSYVDAVFPIVLLNWSNFENLLSGFQLVFSISVSLVCLWLIACQSRTSASPRAGLWIAGACMVILPLCGTQGLVFVPPIVLWLIGTASCEWRRRESGSRLRAGGIGAMTLVGAMIVGLYFRGLAKSSPIGESPTISNAIHTGLEMLSLVWGGGSEIAWPGTGIALAVLMLANASALIIAWIRWPEQRLRVVSLAAVFAGTLFLAVAIGWGRSYLGPTAGFASRYVLLVAPLLFASFVLWTWIGGKLGRIIPLVLLIGVCAFLPRDFTTGSEFAKQRSFRMMLFARDLKAGGSPEVLAARHASQVYPDGAKLAQRLRLLHDAGFSLYASMRADQLCRETACPGVPTTTAWVIDDCDAAGESGDAFDYRLANPQFVHGIRVRFRHVGQQPRGDMTESRCEWSLGSESGGKQTTFGVVRLPECESETCFVVGATIDRIRFVPNRGPWAGHITYLSVWISASELASTSSP